jgi:hypothetical protein
MTTKREQFGFQFEGYIKHILEDYFDTYREATPQQDLNGTDCFIGSIPVDITLNFWEKNGVKELFYSDFYSFKVSVGLRKNHICVIGFTFYEHLTLQQIDDLLDAHDIGEDFFSSLFSRFMSTPLSTVI